MKIKRKISIALILVIVLSMFSGFVYAEEELPNSVKNAFNEIVGSQLMKNFIGSDPGDKVEIAKALLALKEKVNIVESLTDAINQEASGLKEKLKNNGATSEVVNKIVNKINYMGKT